jgi:hypothetical protein
MLLKMWLNPVSRTIPQNELWLHTPLNRKLLDRAITWAEKNPQKETDLGALERKLKRRR